MKVVAFNGSPRKGGNTSILIGHMFGEIEKEGIETEQINLSHKTIHGCIACEKCAQNLDRRCAVKDDLANEYIEKMLGAAGIILGSPVYFQGMTPEMKALIDRTGYVSRSNGRMFTDKVGAALVAVRRAGGISTLDAMNYFFLTGQMIIVGRGLAYGREIGGVETDDEGIGLVKLLGRRMAWLLKKVHG